MEVKNLAQMMLRKSGYTGLINGDCGCSLEDFMPCGECCCNCDPGYLHPDGHVYRYRFCGVDNDPEEVLP
jgi:hypothetical protein